jgi:subtilisin family serine protease
MSQATLGEGSANTTSIPAVGAAFEDRAALLAATSATVSVLGSDYGYMSGTSMATPAVSGVAALVWSNHPTCKGEQIRSALKATAKDAGATGKDVYFGYGIVQAKAASDYLTAQGCGTSGGTAMTLTTRAYSSKGKRYVDLNWTNATTSNVDLYRNSVKIITTPNDGAHTDAPTTRGTFSYQVCEAGSTTKCSPSKSVTL